MLRRLWQRIRPPQLVVWITPELALGPSFHEWQLHLLGKAGIGSVIDVRSEATYDEGALARRDIHFYHVPVDDLKPPTQEQRDEAAAIFGEVQVLAICDLVICDLVI